MAYLKRTGLGGCIAILAGSRSILTSPYTGAGAIYVFYVYGVGAKAGIKSNKIGKKAEFKRNVEKFLENNISIKGFIE